MSMKDRERQLRDFASMLNTDTGIAFVDELRVIWDPIILFDSDPQKNSYKTGLRDAFRFIEEIQNQSFEDT